MVCEHAGEVAGGRESRSAKVLRTVAVDHHHEREHAARHLLSVPLDGGALRDLEAVLQGEAGLRVTDEPCLRIILRFYS